MKIFLIILAITLGNFHLKAQDDHSFANWNLSPSVGINIPTSNLLKGEITDELLGYNENNIYFSVISGQYYFAKKWGIDFTFQQKQNTNLKKRRNTFLEEVSGKYRENYYATLASDYEYNNFFGGSFGLTNIGVVYRATYNKIIFFPKLCFGITSFDTVKGKVYLKERNSNVTHQLTYTSGKEGVEHFTFSPGLTVGHRISDKFIAKIDLQYSTFITDITYVENLENLYNGDIVSETIQYNQRVNAMSIGVGLIFEFQIRKGLIKGVANHEKINTQTQD